MRKGALLLEEESLLKRSMPCVCEPGTNKESKFEFTIGLAGHLELPERWL
jgi:hypothetical protein